jgi:hypothetical protein
VVPSLPGHAGGRGNLGGEVCVVAVVRRRGDGSPEFREVHGEIQSRWFSLTLATGKQKNLSGRCAGERERDRDLPVQGGGGERACTHRNHRRR